MYNPFLSSFMLAVESQRVIELRLVRLAWGGREARAEARSMVVEKVHAAAEVNRLHGPDGVLLHGYGPLGRGEAGSRQRAAFEARQVAVTAWRQARTRRVSGP